MTREERIEYCKICQNRRLDLKKGLVCKLTGEYADFNSYCENFTVDKMEMEYSDIKEKMKKEERKESFRSIIREEWTWILIPYVVFLVVPLFFTLQPLVKSIIITAAVLVIADIIIMRRLEKKMTLTYHTRIRKSSDEQKQTSDDVLTIDRIIHTIKKEGYVPQIDDELSIITFKVEGDTVHINLKTVEDISRYFNIYVKFLLDEYFAEAEMSAMRIMNYYDFSKIIVNREDKYIVFAFSQFCTSAEKFENMFPKILSTLHLSIYEFKKLYFSLLQDEPLENTTPKRSIGFKTTSISDSKN